MLSQQVFSLLHHHLKESVGREGEVSLHVVDVLEGESEHLALLDALHAEVAPIVRPETVL